MASRVFSDSRSTGSTVYVSGQVTYFLTDIGDLPEVREVLLARLADPPPAASLVEISGLIDPRFHVEIEAIASAAA